MCVHIYIYIHTYVCVCAHVSVCTRGAVAGSSGPRTRGPLEGNAKKPPPRKRSRLTHKVTEQRAEGFLKKLWISESPGQLSLLFFFNKKGGL